MSLSDSRIFDIFYDELIKVYTLENTILKISDFFSNFLMSFYAKITVTKNFENWNNIESTVPIILIFLSLEFKNNKRKCFGLSIFPDKINENIMEIIYSAILNEYKICCEKSGIGFVPNIAGLETIICRKLKI